MKQVSLFEKKGLW